MKKGHQLRSQEMAMRVYALTVSHATHHPDFLMRDLVEKVVSRYCTSKSTAFRYVRTAVDVIGIPYDHTARARSKE